MKKLWFVLLTVVMLLASTFPVFAAGNDAPAQRVPYMSLRGKISAVDGTTVSVEVLGGNRKVRQYIGQTVELQTTDTTRFILKTADGPVIISIGDLEVGQKISARVKLVDGIWTAKRITVGAKLLHK